MAIFCPDYLFLRNGGSIMKKNLDISSAGLHLLAMGLMLCDHLWATVVPGND